MIAGEFSVDRLIGYSTNHFSFIIFAEIVVGAVQAVVGLQYY